MAITTNRLTLRTLTPDDFNAWKTAYQNLLPPQSPFDEHPYPPEQLTHTTFNKILKAEQSERNADFAYAFHAFCQQTNQLIGTSQLWNILRFNCQRAVLGFEVLNPHWRNGYGLEIAQATLKFGFQTLNLHRIEAEILPTNAPSIALCQKLGMQSEGLRRQALKVNGQWTDHAIYAITATDPRAK